MSSSPYPHSYHHPYSCSLISGHRSPNGVRRPHPHHWRCRTRLPQGALFHLDRSYRCFTCQPGSSIQERRLQGIYTLITLIIHGRKCFLMCQFDYLMSFLLQNILFFLALSARFCSTCLLPIFHSVCPSVSSLRSYLHCTSCSTSPYHLSHSFPTRYLFLPIVNF